MKRGDKEERRQSAVISLFASSMIDESQRRSFKAGKSRSQDVLEVIKAINCSNINCVKDNAIDQLKTKEKEERKTLSL